MVELTFCWQVWDLRGKKEVSRTTPRLSAYVTKSTEVPFTKVGTYGWKRFGHMKFEKTDVFWVEEGG